MQAKQQNLQFQPLTTRTGLPSNRAKSASKPQHSMDTPLNLEKNSRLHPSERFPKSRAQHSTKPSYEAAIERGLERKLVGAAYQDSREKYYSRVLSKFHEHKSEREKMLQMLKEKDKVVEQMWQADFRADRLNVMRTNGLSPHTSRS